MLTKEENQLLINEFVEKNVDAITNLGEDKQKAIFDAILLIQNKFGNVTQSLLKDDFIKQKQDEPLPFKVGDKFYIDIRGKGNIYIIDSIDSNRVVVKIKLNDGQIYDYDYSIEEVKKAFEDGTWVKIEDELPFKIGDLLFYSFIYKITEVIDVNQGVVKLMTSNNYKETLDLDKLNKQINDGEKRKLPFSIGDTFVDPQGNFYKIFELYPNNEKSVWVKVNYKIDLEVYQWDLIEDYVNDNYWMPATKAEAEQIRADYLKGQQTQPQVQSNTFKFNIGDTFEVVSNKSTWTIVDIVKDFDEYIIKNDDNPTTTPISRKLLEEDVEAKRLVQIFVNQPLTTSTTTTTTSKALIKKPKTSTKTTTTTKTPIGNKDEEIEALEEAIETQKLLLSFADTKDEKEEIKNLLKDLRSQLKNLKK
jgi:hypothetical protein